VVYTETIWVQLYATNLVAPQLTSAWVGDECTTNVLDQDTLGLVVHATACLWIKFARSCGYQLVELLVLPGVASASYPPVHEVRWIDEVVVPLDQTKVDFLSGHLLHVHGMLYVAQFNLYAQVFLEYALNSFTFFSYLTL